MHIFEFVLNEFIDVDVDRLSPDLAEKPLVKSSISLNAALAVIFGSMILSFVLTFLFFFDIWVLIMLSLAFEFGAIYDIHGKRFAGSDFSLAFWIFFFCLFGASVVSNQYTGILFLVAGMGFFQILFNNAVEGGIKDADHDWSAGAHTLAHSFGVKVRNKKLIIPPAFKVASYIIKLGSIVLIIFLIIQINFNLTNIYDYLRYILVILLILIIWSVLLENNDKIRSAQILSFLLLDAPSLMDLCSKLFHYIAYIRVGCSQVEVSV